MYQLLFLFLNPELIKRTPDLMRAAMRIHNNVIRRAKRTNFGFTVQQEGGSYSISFYEAADAVKFCLQVRVWPCIALIKFELLSEDILKVASVCVMLLFLCTMQHMNHE